MTIQNILTEKNPLAVLFAAGPQIVRDINKDGSAQGTDARNRHPLCQKLALACEARVAKSNYRVAYALCDARGNQPLYQRAVFCQQACNLSGVLNSLPDVIQQIRQEWIAENCATDVLEFIDQHPASRLYVEQIVYLALQRSVQEQ
jgi:hypothetical protein